jgi:hypothetical protein
MAEVFKEWQVPPQAASEDRRLGWLNEAAEEGLAWLKSQRGYGDFNKSMDILSGKGATTPTDYRSHIATNGLKRDVREVISGLANIRPLWGYHTDNKAFTSNATMMNKVTRAIYLEQFFDRSLKEALQYAAATCTGWVRPVYRRGMSGTGKGNIQLLTYGSPCVLPVQLPSNNDWQEAYAVTLMDEVPIYMAHSMFPDFQDKLHPTSSRYWYSPEIRGAATGNLWKRMWGTMTRTNDSPLTDLYIPLRYTTVIDLTINHTGQMIPMGELGSPWYYEVPSYGSDIFVGKDKYGNATFRKADANDARLYPFRRQIISSESCICYDGPAFNWHGELDLIPFCVDDWPWEAIGFSLVHEGYDLQQAEHLIERGVMDKITAQLDLPLGYDINAVTSKEAKQFDPMKPRSRVGFDGSLVERPFAPLVPDGVYEVRPEVLTFLKDLRDSRQYQLGIKDVVALAKARSVAKGNDELDTLMEAQGPIVKDISRSMERGLSRIGGQLKYLVLEYLDTHRLMQYVGEDGLSEEVFDYDPTSLIPSHLPGEVSTDPVTEVSVASQYSKIQRAKWFAENLKFTLLPHSVHEITQMTHRLLLLQDRKAGLPIPSKTIFESQDLGNVDEMKREYWEEQQELITNSIKLQALAKAEGIEFNVLDMLTAGKGGSAKGKGGRPSSGQTGPRTVVKESK